MKNIRIKILLVFFTFLFISCLTNKGLIKREKTDFGTLKYYAQTEFKDKNDEKRIVIKVEDSVYYSFYSNAIGKRTKNDMNSVYQLYYDELPKELNAQITYQKLSKLDSLVLSNSNKVLDSLKWNNFKRWDGATAFEIEVVYYHGFLKNGKFKPF